jgi:hypothetical protein
VSVSYRVGDHAHLTQSRGPFGPETALVVGVVVAGVAAMVAYQQESAHAEHHAAATGKSRAKGDPAKKMDADFADLGASITVYIITNNKPPASLDDLTQPAPPDYPKGYTQGQPLPIDPWGHAYAYNTDGKDDYKIWSIGPNGIDEHGAAATSRRSAEPANPRSDRSQSRPRAGPRYTRAARPRRGRMREDDATLPAGSSTRAAGSGARPGAPFARSRPARSRSA